MRSAAHCRGQSAPWLTLFFWLKSWFAFSWPASSATQWLVGLSASVEMFAASGQLTSVAGWSMCSCCSELLYSWQTSQFPVARFHQSDFRPMRLSLPFVEEVFVPLMKDHRISMRFPRRKLKKTGPVGFMFERDGWTRMHLKYWAG